MLVVHGLEDAIVGVARIDGRFAVCYSADRIRIGLEEAGVVDDELDIAILMLLEKIDSVGTSSDNDHSPIVIHTIDNEELMARHTDGDFDS